VRSIKSESFVPTVLVATTTVQDTDRAADIQRRRQQVPPAVAKICLIQKARLTRATLFADPVIIGSRSVEKQHADGQLNPIPIRNQ